MNLEEISKNYSALTLEEQKQLHSLFIQPQTSLDLKRKLENIIFRITPPTPLEYLDHRNGWITKEFQNTLFDYIKEDFLEILNPDKVYKQVVEYGATRLGKSHLLRMIIHYIVIYLHCLRHPQLYYGLAPTTSLSIYLMCFKSEKTKEILLSPLFRFFDDCPRMKKIKFQDKVKEENYKIGYDSIVWSKAGTGSEITLDSGLTLNLGTDFMSFIGSDLLFLAVSEINFFIHSAGASYAEIFQLYTDGVARIKATVSHNYLGMVFLDSSANDEDNPIESYLLNDLKKQEKVFFRQRAKWEIKNGKRISLGLDKQERWEKTGETFKICIGNANTEAKIITDENELSKLPITLIRETPIDLLENAQRNILKHIKDDHGIPTKKENIFIQNPLIIDAIFDNDLLENPIALLYADAAEQPDKLLWNQLYHNYFVKYNVKDLIIKRASNEPRFIGIDLAYSTKGDVLGISCCHKEWSRQINKIIYVCDFSFGILGKATGINLEAIQCFIMNLREIGNMSIHCASMDTFSSQPLIQFLERFKIIAHKHSVDRTIDDYMNLYNLILNDQIKCGKNIFLKNNLKSLVLSKKDGKEKIDHSEGTTEHHYNGNWLLSKAGINDKDVSDSLAQAVFGALSFDLHPICIYEEENKKIDVKEDKTDFIRKGFDTLHKFY